LEIRCLLASDIRGLVWNDANSNGLLNSGEPGVSGTLVELVATSDTVIGNSDDQILAGAATDSTGNYVFSAVPDGQYYLRFREEPVGGVGHRFTTADVGSDDSIDSDVIPAEGRSAVFAHVATAPNVIDAGLIEEPTNLAFAFPFNGEKTQQGRAVAVDAQGNLYVGIRSDSNSVDLDPGPAITSVVPFNGDQLVAKYTADGQFLWGTSFGSGQFGSLAVDAQDNVYVTGDLSGNAVFGPGPGATTLPGVSQRAFAAKFDSAGNVLWVRQLQVVSRGIDISVDAAGSAYITGEVAGSSSFNPMAWKLDTNGVQQWQVQGAGATSLSIGQGIYATATTTYITGRFQGTVDLDPSSAVANLTSGGSDDIFLWQLNSVSGAYVSAIRIGGTGSDVGSDLTVSSDGNILLTGYYNGTVDFDPSPAVSSLTASDLQAFVLKLHPDNSLSWVRDAQQGSSAGLGIAVSDSGQVWSTGSFTNSVDFDPAMVSQRLLTSNGGTDCYVWGLDSSGNLLSAYGVGSANYDQANEVALSPSGDRVLVAGNLEGTADFDPEAGTLVLSAIESLNPTSAIDGFLWAITTGVQSVNTAPVITSNGGVDTANISVPENTTAVTDVDATDPDAGTTLTYSINGGADAAKFAINSASGVLTFVSAPNFESPTDSGGNNVYDVIVKVSDGTLTDMQTIAVTVTNVNEAPTITSNGGNASANISVPENTTPVTDVDATDPDAGTTLTYSISGGADAAKFAISSTTGVLSFAAAPDFENPTDADGDNVYQVTVRASDGSLSDTQDVSVTVTDVFEACGMVVSNTNNSGTGSLRDAINCANNKPGTDTISFNIPGSGVHTISPTAALPTITDPVVIDGYTQPGTGQNSSASGFNGTLLIELNGSGAGVGSNGLIVTAGSSTIRGLVINRFSNSGLLLLNGGGNHTEGNFIGTSASGLTAAGNESNGITLDAGSNNNTIGGAAAAARNVISGTLFGSGIEIDTSGNVVAGNLVGVSALGTAALPNQSGVTLFSGTGNVIGTNGDGVNDAAESNVISGNRGSGVAIVSSLQSTPSQNIVAGNYIGTDAAGDAIGNELYGVMTSVTNNTIGPGNVIAFNGSRFGGPGVILLNGTARNTAIVGNSIFSNFGLGIDLHGDGPTPNDQGDADSGDNNLQNFPVISSATVDVTTVRVQYAVPSTTANSAYPLRVEFFKADSDGQEGQAFLGFDTYTAAQAGTSKTAVFTSAAGLAVGDKLVATATDNQGNTSEFSASVAVAAPPCSTVVVNTNDTGAGSLRDAITCANSLPNIDRTGDGTVDPDPITFAISANDPGHFYYRNDAINGGLKNITATTASDDSTISNIDPDWRHSWYSIQVSTPLPALTDPATIDGYSQVGAIANANGVSLADSAVLKMELVEASGSKGSGTSGLSLSGGGSTISGLVIDGFDNHAIQIGSDGNTVAGNFIGTDISGTHSQGNGGDGVNIAAHKGNLVGGAAVTARNLIGNNAGSGIALVSGASQNRVSGNSIFHNAGGIGINEKAGAAGVLVNESAENTVGGTETGAGNLINGNASGILIVGGSAEHNLVLGNSVGPSNDDGVVIRNAHDNTIGGLTSQARNVISGNADTGLLIESTDPSTPSSNNLVQGNYIGTDATGTQKSANSYMGIRLEGADFGGGVKNNVIGGVAAGAGNLISGNDLRGILVQGSLASDNLIQGNFIGTQAGGTGALGNTQVGIELLAGAHDNSIGGPTAGSRNIISANGTAGVWIDGLGSTNNLVQGNRIGTDVTGTLDLGNSSEGVEIWDQASGNSVLQNIVSGNDGEGIILSFGVKQSLIEGNLIGVAADGASPLPNGHHGIFIDGGLNNTIGGTSVGQGNIIAFNGKDGINVSDSSSGADAIFGNSIFSNGELGIDLQSPNDTGIGVTLNDAGDADDGANKLQNFPVITDASVKSAKLSMTYSVPSAISSSSYPLRIEFFKADADGQEGQTFLGFDTYLAAEATTSKTVAFTPMAGLAAGSKIVATATDSNGNTSEFGSGFTLQFINAAPVITSNGGGDSAIVSVAENSTAVTDVDATDPDAGQTLTYSIAGGADAGKFSIDSTSGALMFIVAPNYENPADSDTNNIYEVVVGVSDGSDTDSQTLSVTVVNVNEPPVAQDDGYETSEDSSLTIAAPGLLTNDTDPDSGDVKSVVGVNGLEANVGQQIVLTSGALLTANSNGSYQYDPNGAFEFLGAGESQNDYFSYTIADRQGAVSSATVTITVRGANDAPVAGNDQFSVDEDTLLSVNAKGILANDYDLDGDQLMLAVKSQPGHGQLVLRMDGSFTYMPQKDYNGPDAFTYQLSDGQTTSNVATVSISVKAVNDRPVVTLGGDLMIDEGTAFSARGSFSDPDSGDAWTASVDYGDGTQQALVLAADKTFSLGHAYRDNGLYTVTVAVHDSGPTTATASFQVRASNVAPQQLTWAGPTQALLGQNVVFTGGFSDPGLADTETASVDWGDGSMSDATVTGGSGVWQVLASHTFFASGTHAVVVTVKDDDGGMATKSATIATGGTGVSSGVLTIVGSEQRDDLKLTLLNQTLLVSGTLAGAAVSQSFSLAGVQRIMADLHGGDDSFAVDAKIKLPLLVNAGAGNDVVHAGSGISVLIGGTGQDSLYGGSRTDLLIAGTTAYDANSVALAAILSEWSSSRTLATRVKNLRTAAGAVLHGTGIALVAGKTVLNDASVDTLIGNGDFDWFMFDGKKDKVKDLLRGEPFN
jgi:VCBS repeat-containing protein